MISAGDTGFMIIASAMVMFMTPGLAFFYGGLSRRKNVLNTMMMSIATMGLASVIWVICGYSLSFSGDGGFLGNLKWAFFNNVSWEAGPYADTIPNTCFAIFQMMFAMITPALLTGAIAGRMKFKAVFLFIFLWLFAVYFPMAHMVWGKGFIDRLGAIDFAGGNVVHISSGVSALVLCLVLGRRRDYGKKSVVPHHIPFVVLGASMLWFGWYGFNGGSALKADGLAIHAMLTSNTSAACAMLSWMLIDVIKDGRPTIVGACTGAVAGLVAITPGAGFVPVWASFIIGLLVSPVCYFSMSVLKQKFKYDDALDAFGCHGMGGIYGCIVTGLFADPAVNGKVGLFFGSADLFIAQLISIVITAALAIVGTLVCLGIVKLVVKQLRVDDADEARGMDEAEHGEIAYNSFQ
jgi:Amt family ammonium transporter